MPIRERLCGMTGPGLAWTGTRPTSWRRTSPGPPGSASAATVPAWPGDVRRRRRAARVAVPGTMSAPVSTVPGVNGTRRLYQFELEPEVRDWLDSLSDLDYKRVDEVCGMLAGKGTSLGGPWSDHLDGAVWELRLRLAQVAVRVTHWCRPDGVIVLLTVFRKTRQHDQRQTTGRCVRSRPASAATGARQGRCMRGRRDDRLPHPVGAA
jgi:hypothetical protein